MKNLRRNLMASVGAGILMSMACGVALAVTDYGQILSKMEEMVPIQQQQLDDIAQYAATGAPGMSHNDKIELAGALTNYGRVEEGRALTEQIYASVSAKENQIADERLVFVSSRHEPYVEESPKTVVDLRGLARKCASRSYRYAETTEEAVYKTRGAVLEYQKHRTTDTRIPASGSLIPYSDKNQCLNNPSQNNALCVYPAEFRYDRMAFPATEAIQNPRENTVFIRHLVPTKKTKCNFVRSEKVCSTSYVYTENSESKWGSLICRID